LIRADLHGHTFYSPDAVTAPQDYVAACLRRGINCVAITDHNTIRGALAVQKLAPFTVIIGEEVRTREGEVIGLFLVEEVPGGLSPEETVRRIKEQGGLVVIPHPFDRRALRPQALQRILPQVDVIEAFNARVLRSSENEQALAFARERGLATCAGSDAHSPGEVGNAYVEMEEFQGPREFLQALREGRIVGRLATPLVHLISTWARFQRYMGWRPAR